MLIIGRSAREYNGEMFDQFVERRLRDEKAIVDSFYTQIEHAIGYGGVDRLGKGVPRSTGFILKWYHGMTTS